MANNPNDPNEPNEPNNPIRNIILAAVTVVMAKDLNDPPYILNEILVGFIRIAEPYFQEFGPRAIVNLRGHIPVMIGALREDDVERNWKEYLLSEAEVLLVGMHEELQHPPVDLHPPVGGKRKRKISKKRKKKNRRRSRKQSSRSRRKRKIK